ncbi:MAG: DUF3098 domain-containing protein [Bacteroidetes bacterium]|nr:DUF3098 domain-containing protein [Bacteroidota bacterium]NCQ11718.1 DUF3098 domain-containing protein [Bacteroidota bacterium]
MARRNSVTKTVDASNAMVFTKENYILLIIGITLIFIGFLIMYLENEIDGFISLYVSPVLIVGGFSEIVYAIMKKSTKSNS